jgi:ribosomal protein S18 acetylase RimI-like enzyme
MQARRMLKQDIPAVVEIDMEDADPWDEATTRSMYRARHSSSWVVEDASGKIGGYCIVTSDWMITSVLKFRVAKAFQGMGGGDALLKTLIGATMDACSIEAHIGKGESAAQVLFGRNGFACVNDVGSEYIFRKGDRFLHAPDLKYRMTSEHAR